MGGGRRRWSNTVFDVVEPRVLGLRLPARCASLRLASHEPFALDLERRRARRLSDFLPALVGYAFKSGRAVAGLAYFFGRAVCVQRRSRHFLADAHFTYGLAHIFSASNAGWPRNGRIIGSANQASAIRITPVKNRLAFIAASRHNPG
ncbi:hypothetical protein [Caballeronia sp. Sq4a]|uniref:hypothetical protein n=1 Tax=Caballeronia sp. Sq4a TaxID=2878152 RepID=UPI0020BD9E6A|nr:hypothetical protein [Caballeronia sp. Sq4a]